LVIVAVVVVLAALSTVAFLTLGGDGDGKAASAGPAANGGGDGTGTDTGTNTNTGKEEDANKDDAEDGQGGSGEATGGQPSGGPKTDDPAGGNALPDGYVMVSNDRFHFAMAMLKGFRLTGIAGQNSGGIFSANGGFPRVQVDFNDSPKDNAAAAWSAAVKGTRARSNGYKHLGIKKVDYNGYPTVADWQFERNQRGVRVRVLNRGFKVDAKRGYSIMISCRASEWDSAKCVTLRKTAFATFRPKN
jgi:hypothetical protein